MHVSGSTKGRFTMQHTDRSACPLAAVALFSAISLQATGAGAQQLPTPLAYVSQLDLECHDAPPLPPPVPQLFIRQLNPVLQDELPNQVVALGPLREVCVPVAKNGRIPGPLTLPVIEWTDQACYQAAAPPVDVEVTASHLNPELAHLADEDVKLVELERVCLPVRKNDSEPPEFARRIVRHVDTACYRLEEPSEDAETPLDLTHLNPEIIDAELPDREAKLRRARRLCVPIGKEQQEIPDDVRRYVEWVDFLQYVITPRTPGAVPAFELPIPLVLHHMNPLFVEQPPFFVQLQTTRSLMVPIAKDGVLPPSD
jgi:hypothetical protein